MTELVRVAALTGYREVMAALGVDPAPLLREQGLSPAMLTELEAALPAQATSRLLERSAEVSGCLTLGLRMAEQRSLANLGAASLLIAHQPTLRLAIAALTEFRSAINSTLILQFAEGPDQAILREDFALRRPEPTRQSSDLAVGVAARLCATVLGESWAPLSVCFAHAAPPAREMAIYPRLFRCRPEFDCEFNGLVIDPRDLDRPNRWADPQLAVHARQLLASTMGPAGRSTAQEVEQLILPLLPTGRATIEICAATLGLTVRSLQRRLAAEGASFSAVLHAARMQLATQYLANPRMRITEVAQLLGYGSIGAFSRWHVATFGQPPLKWRKGRGGS